MKIYKNHPIITKIPQGNYHSLKFNKTYNEYGRIYNRLLDGVRCIQFVAKQGSTGGSYMSRYVGYVYGAIFITNVSGYLRFAVYDNNNVYKFVQSDNAEFINGAAEKHVSMHFKSAVGMEMYVEGVKQAMTTTFDLPMKVATQDAFVGARAQVSQYFSDNEMSHMKFWTTHRDQADVLSDMNSYPTGVVTNLKAYIPTIKTGETTFEDTQGNYNGVLVSNNVGGDSYIENNMFQTI
jgi:hypothetical protein